MIPIDPDRQLDSRTTQLGADGEPLEAAETPGDVPGSDGASEPAAIALGDDGAPLDPDDVSSPKELALFVLRAARNGEMWVGWSPEGRPSFGDQGEPIPEGVTLTDDPTEVALLAGVAYAHFVRLGEAMEAAERKAHADKLVGQATDAATIAGGGIVVPLGANRAQRRRARR